MWRTHMNRITGVVLLCTAIGVSACGTDRGGAAGPAATAEPRASGAPIAASEQGRNQERAGDQPGAAAGAAGSAGSGQGR